MPPTLQTNPRNTSQKARSERPDRHILYQRAVQNPEAEIDFVDRVFRSLRQRKGARIREDFCGTAANSCEWVRRRSTNTAVGLDLDQPTLDWGRAHNLARLGPGQQPRVTLLKRNVLTPGADAKSMDAILALNFSWWIFKERDTLVRYFRTVRESLVRDGLFILDIYGGYESFDEQQERRPIGRGKNSFTYIWDQESFDPITNETLCHIHFKLKNGQRLDKAFTYDWRIWTIPETQDILADAGFKRSIVYWEGSNSRGGGNGVFRPAKHGTVCAAFIAYIVAER